MSVKPYFRPENTYNVKPDELEVTAEPDEPEATAESDELEAPLPTPEVPQELAKPTIKRGQKRPRKHPITKNLVMENYLTSTGISARQSLHIDISVLVQETLFTDL